MSKQITIYNKNTKIGWRAFPPISTVNMLLPVTVVSNDGSLVTFSDGAILCTGNSTSDKCVVINDPYLFSKFIEFVEVGDELVEGVEDV